MSAPGIRAYHMAQVLGRHVPNATVTLGCPSYSDVAPEPEFRVKRYSRWSALTLLFRYDIVISLGFPPVSLVAWPGRTFVLDFFSNFAMEWMEVGKTQRNYRKRWAWYETARQYINEQLTAADFVICNNDRQRDAWLGMMQSLGLITGEVYDKDHSLRRLVAVCPHGLRSDPLATASPSSGQWSQADSVHPPTRANNEFAASFGDSPYAALAGIRSTDKVLLWNAGIVGWYDPVTAIRAVHQLGRADVKLVFMGSKYPDPGFLEENPTFKAAIETAEALGVTDKSVFFVRGWLPYEEVKDYLRGAYLGLCTYFNNAETHYSHRTRFLDLFWGELPVVCTRGDVLSGLVEEQGLGIVVPEGDTEAVVMALRRLLDGHEEYEQMRARLRTLKETMTWDQTLWPLVEFCRAPQPVAAFKRERALPLARRVLGYLFWRLAQKVVR